MMLLYKAKFHSIESVKGTKGSSLSAQRINRFRETTPLTVLLLGCNEDAQKRVVSRRQKDTARTCRRMRQSEMFFFCSSRFLKRKKIEDKCGSRTGGETWEWTCFLFLIFLRHSLRDSVVSGEGATRGMFLEAARGTLS